MEIITLLHASVLQRWIQERFRLAVVFAGESDLLCALSSCPGHCFPVQ